MRVGHCGKRLSRRATSPSSGLGSRDSLYRARTLEGVLFFGDAPLPFIPDEPG